MQFSFTAVSKITLECKPGDKKSTHVATDFRLEVEGLPENVYLTPEELPSKEGIKPLTLAFVHGLVGNIHSAHEQGFWDSAEHLRYCIDELTRGFASVAHTFKSKM